MISKLLFLNNYSTDCYENLAIEKELLTRVEGKTVILYLWQNQNTVVIGKNQNPFAECDIEKTKEDGVNIARRLSGGGAVFHDKGNLNFTFISAKENYSLEKQVEVIKKACALAGINAEISGRNDILVDSKKFSGNAFYHTKTVSLHHGTLLINSNLEKVGKYLTPDLSKLQSKGVKSVKSRVINLCEINPDLTCDIMREYMVSAAEDVYGVKAEEYTDINSLKDKEIIKLYSSREYIFTTPIPYTAVFKGRLDLGQFEIRILVKNEKIEDLQVFTDALDVKIPETIKNLLIGEKYVFSVIEKKLISAFDSNFANQIIGLMKGPR